MPANQPSLAQGRRVLAELGEFLRAHRDDITRLWIAAVDRSPQITSSGDLTYRQLLDHLPQICDELADALQATPAAPETVPPAGPDAAAHGRIRWEQGYSLEEVIREVCLLRRNIFDRWLPDFRETQPEFAGEIRRSAEQIIRLFFDEVIVESTMQFVRENRDHARRVRYEFLSRMGHDLRTPLTPILLATTSLKEEGNLRPAELEMIDMIARNATLEAALLDKLLREAEHATKAR